MLPAEPHVPEQGWRTSCETRRIGGHYPLPGRSGKLEEEEAKSEKWLPGHTLERATNDKLEPGRSDMLVLGWNDMLVVRWSDMPVLE